MPFSAGKITSDISDCNSFKAHCWTGYTLEVWNFVRLEV